MKTTLALMFITIGCTTPINNIDHNANTDAEVYTVVAECGYGVACPWTAPEHASDIFTTTNLVEAKARFISDGDQIATTAATQACALGGIARRLTTQWGAAMNDADIECNTPDGRTFHLLAYVSQLNH